MNASVTNLMRASAVVKQWLSMWTMLLLLMMLLL